ncbi:P-loop containing nucleoside triphosphate hydrolase protein [Ochromonadaceae sp. CCMP2298]|nr:P-loop containing nucleoside triphosphate hydrolase protein [Ochromonadaceae sp. CCMP2298]
MSSRMELKARGVKRLQKAKARSLDKRSSHTASIDRADSQTPDFLHSMLPVPKKRSSTTIVHRKRQRDTSIDTAPRLGRKNKPLSMRKTKPSMIQDFSKAAAFMKTFWAGGLGEDPPSEALKLLRKDIGVLVKGNIINCPAPVSDLQSEFIPKRFAIICGNLGVTKPSPVQMQCWPAILNGANLLAIAPTGSGKTLAFCLPMIPHILAQIDQKKLQSKAYIPESGNKLSPKALVLVPTRELALQVVSVLKALRRSCGIYSGAVYGGQDKNEQLAKLKFDCGGGGDLHVLVATPGRLEDLLYTAHDGSALKLDVSSVTYLVMDEADRMLTMGFADQLNAISSCIRPDRQTMLFSATFPGKLREAAEEWVSEAVVVRCSAVEFASTSNTGKEKVFVEGGEGEEEDEMEISDEEGEGEEGEEGGEGEGAEPAVKKVKFDAAVDTSQDTASSLTISPSVAQRIHVCASHKKPRLLLKYITAMREQEKTDKVRQKGPMIIFCNKIKTLKFVQDFLRRQKVVVDALHGGLVQSVRETVLKNFKSGKTNTLIATDVAARGLHINRLQYVVNYDFPLNLEQYCHRVGRTGRQGQSGCAYSLLTRNLAVLARDLIKLLAICQQEPEPNLTKLADEYALGLTLEDTVDVPDEASDGEEANEEANEESTDV